MPVRQPDRRTDRREAMKQALLNRTKESHEHRDDTGMYGDIFRDDVEGMIKWRCKEAQHLVDIIPYVAGNLDPNTKEGEWTYVLDLWVHQRVGVNQDSFVCPSRNYNKPCPICEYREKLRAEEEYDEELIKSLYPKRRVIYNIICYDDPKEEQKGVQVWEVAHFFMEKKLMSIAKIPARGGSGGGYVAFADPDEGKTIQFERKGGKDNTEFLGHQFLPRDYKLEDDVLNNAFQLDQIIVIPTYEELSHAFYADEGGERENGTGAEVEKAPEPEKEVETPQPAGRSRLIQRGKPVETEKQPLQRGARTRLEMTCPGGGTFGVDCEDLPECGKCEFWDDCSAKKDEAAAKEAEEKEKQKKETEERGRARTPAPAGKGPVTPAPRRGLIGRR